jgi:hypothetical protein
MANSSIYEGVFSWSFPSSARNKSVWTSKHPKSTWKAIHLTTHPGMLWCIDALGWKGAEFDYYSTGRGSVRKGIVKSLSNYEG